jgi:hypothetical protein
MRRRMMTAGGVTLAGLGVLVGLAVGSGEGPAKLIAQRTQPVEVRTEVIRKTINVYRRAKPHHVAAAGAPGGASSYRASSAGSSVAATGVTRTRSSGTGAVAPAASARPVISTRSSGSKATSGSGSTRAVSTRSSGGGGDGGDGGGGGGGGGHGD